VLVRVTVQAEVGKEQFRLGVTVQQRNRLFGCSG
jgi:hypothetical protein